MDFREFWHRLTEDAKKDFLIDVGTTNSVMQLSYLRKDPLRRNRPSNERIAKMVRASRYRLSVNDLQEYFCGEPSRIYLSNIENEENPQ